MSLTFRLALSILKRRSAARLAVVAFMLTTSTAAPGQETGQLDMGADARQQIVELVDRPVSPADIALISAAGMSQETFCKGVAPPMPERSKAQIALARRIAFGFHDPATQATIVEMMTRQHEQNEAIFRSLAGVDRQMFCLELDRAQTTGVLTFIEANPRLFQSE